ncbi:Tat pathway signal protein [Puteibacter caeruleilacunae]|nr:Tat pathway signal protein [Puteibacter caeruleilacunae]
MRRRNAIKLAAGAFIGGGACVTAMTTAFKTEAQAATPPKKIDFKESKTVWQYHKLNPKKVAKIAYEGYDVGSCMFGVFESIMAELGEQYGEPYASFPSQMMKYGHSGVGGSGTICGTLNGAGAIIGLFVEDKKIQDALMGELFYWYENTEFPIYKPAKPVMDFTPPTSVAHSILCHASTTLWGKASGFRIKSKERKERCRCLTADVAKKTAVLLNKYINNEFVANEHDNETVRGCMTCHGEEGKLGNTAGKMTCTSCHTPSAAHKVFGDAHYKFMDKK